jgi:hypothetical protein
MMTTLSSLKLEYLSLDLVLTAVACWHERSPTPSIGPIRDHARVSSLSRLLRFTAGGLC